MTVINEIIKRLKAAAIGFVMVMFSLGAHAQTMYADPDAPGHGVTVTQDSGQGSAFIWYLYDRTGNPTWLISTENCTEYPCQTRLATSAGTWMGGDFELVNVGSVTVDFIEGDLFWEYNLAEWPAAGDCGRLVWLYQTKCVGSFTMQAID